MSDPLLFHELGDWPESAVRTHWVASSHLPPADVLDSIEHAWKAGTAKPGVKLFDGPMCRMEFWQVVDGRLDVTLSPTSYRIFWGTNLMHPALAEKYGRAVLANPIGVSPALETADGFLLMGRRNDKVAYYPGRLHPFAGCLEPADAGEGRAPNLFNAVRRELAEELSLESDDLLDIRCTGVVEDIALRQPELIFRVTSRLTRAEIEARLSRDEHDAIVTVPATADGLKPLLEEPLITPVGRASILLWGRARLGQTWFEAARHC